MTINLEPTVTAPDFGKNPYGYYEWHLTHHPEMYTAFRHRADAYRLGNPAAQVSADMICHVLRYFSGAHAKDDKFRVNNVLTPLYARIYKHERPEARMSTRGSQLDALTPEEWTALLALVPQEEHQDDEQ